jgi:phosphoglucosamine mutase
MSLARRSPTGLRVTLDCANGSGGKLAPEIIEATGATVSVHFDDPDGSNINLDCGATAPAALAALTAREGSDAGFALDGDADRCVAVDERGQVVDGDQLLGIVALDRLHRAALAESTLVVSVLSNGGLAAIVEGAGGHIVRTPVGDKYILDAMLVSGAGVGGEKSGHVIIREHTSSGDGIVTALEILSIMGRTGRRLSELAADVPLYPQQQRAVTVRHKDQWEADRHLAAAVRAAEAELVGRGRILVRPSGTEPALRIMVEGEDAARVLALAESLSALAAERLNQPG